MVLYVVGVLSKSDDFCCEERGTSQNRELSAQLGAQLTFHIKNFKMLLC